MILIIILLLLLLLVVVVVVVVVLPVLVLLLLVSLLLPLVLSSYVGTSNGQFSEFQICFCGLDPGNLKFETVRTNRQQICF